MLKLRDIQRAFARSILSGRGGSLEKAIVGSDIPAQDRLRIHANTARTVLTESLRLHYPAVCRLVGNKFFDMAAARFMYASPPKSGYLNEHGQYFAAFLAAMPETAGLPYLPDVARFEWALSQAANASDAATLDLLGLAGIDVNSHRAIRFVPHPSVRLLSLNYPADAIADAVMARDDNAMATLNILAAPVFLVVHRNADGVIVERISGDVHAFLGDLFSGHSLDALMKVSGIDVVQCLADQFSRARLAAFCDEPRNGPRGNIH